MLLVWFYHGVSILLCNNTFWNIMNCNYYHHTWMIQRLLRGSILQKWDVSSILRRQFFFLLFLESYLVRSLSVCCCLVFFWHEVFILFVTIASKCQSPNWGTKALLCTKDFFVCFVSLFSRVMLQQVCGLASVHVCMNVMRFPVDKPEDKKQLHKRVTLEAGERQNRK